MTVGVRRYPAKNSPYKAACHVHSVDFTINPESTDTITINGQALDPGGNAITEKAWLDFYLSSDSTGLTPTTATGVAKGTNGEVIEWTAEGAGKIITEEDGTFDVAINQTGGAATKYLNICLPDGRIQTSAAATFA